LYGLLELDGTLVCAGQAVICIRSLKLSGSGDYDAAGDAVTAPLAIHGPLEQRHVLLRSGCNAGEWTMVMVNLLVEKCAGGMLSDGAADDEYIGNIGIQCLGL